jgi:D-3-phosphoglycerate dehydrogenase
MLEDQGFEVDLLLDYDDETLHDHVRSANGWIVRSGTTVTADLIEMADELKVIGRAGVGVDNIDLDAATRKGVLVCNAPDGNTISTAEHTTAMMQALARTIPQANRSLLSGKWERKKYSGAELHGKTLGIVGVGKVGRAVAERMQGFGMSLLGFDPLVSEDVAARHEISLVDLDTLIAESDFITIHTPMNEETRGLLDADAFDRCKDDVRIINCARGGIVDEMALLDALNNGKVGGAALDVYSQEPPPAELDDLIQHPRVVATPHIAATTGAAQEKVAQQITEQVINGLTDEPVTTPVNGMAIRMAAQPEAQTYLELADRLGQIAYQLMEGNAQSLTVRCRGDVPRRYAEVLSVAALRGVLNQWADEPVNFINAPVLAEDMGLRFSETREAEHGSYTNLVEVEVQAGDETHVVGGTIFHGTDLRLVRIDTYELEAKPEGEMILYRNVDKPGMLATVGDLLARANINIGALALGRKARGEMALTAVSVDDEVPADVLQQIAGLDGVEGVRSVKIR